MDDEFMTVGKLRDLLKDFPDNLVILRRGEVFFNYVDGVRKSHIDEDAETLGVGEETNDQSKPVFLIID